jgi:hypothetical protein
MHWALLASLMSSSNLLKIFSLLVLVNLMQVEANNEPIVINS